MYRNYIYYIQRIDTYIELIALFEISCDIFYIDESMKESIEI